MAKKDDNSKVCAILSYLLIGVIWYFADEKMRKNKFAKFHAKQALVLILTSIAANVVLSLIIVIGWILMPLVQLFLFVLMILGIINAANMKEKELPIIGGFARHLNF